MIFGNFSFSCLLYVCIKVIKHGHLYVGSKSFLKGWKPGFLSNLANSLLLDPDLERRVKSTQILADPDPVPQHYLERIVMPEKFCVPI